MRVRLLSALIGIPALLAAPAAAEKVTFTYRPATEVHSVSLRGDFNGWGETPMARGEDGAWSVTVDLPPGEHAYKYFIDGVWPQSMESGPDGAPLDPAADRYVDDGFGGKNAVRAVGGAKAAPSTPASGPAPALREGYARIHYHRPGGDYDGWGLHVWEDADEQVTWGSPLAPTGEDDFGIYWDVKLREGAKRVGFLVHKGDQKDPGPDLFLDLPARGREAWLVSGRSTIHAERPEVESLAYGDLGLRRAHWVDAGTVAWRVRRGPQIVYRLHAAPRGGLRITPSGVTGGEVLDLRLDSAGIQESAREKFPHLAGLTALRLAPEDLDLVSELLKGEVAVSATGPDGVLLDATGLQIPGVLDDLFAYDGPLGVTWESGVPTFRLWAPTARSVSLLVFDGSSDEEPLATRGMTEEKGLWVLEGEGSWNGKFYLYEVEVYVPETGRVERNRVTDPYSRSLSMNGTRSQAVDLDDPSLQPPGWSELEKPPLAAPEDMVLYELHVRDFSAADPDVPLPYRGTFLAFSVDGRGARRLKELAAAGLTHVHLLPAFDFATVNENKVRWRTPEGDLSGFPPDSEEQQARVSAVANLDGYNWGYDPVHYGVPEGSYSTEPDGSRRIYEFRQMVQSLSAMGLRVVMDVVYNHTHAAGQDPLSVLDRIVPGYYHRLNADGEVETSTCCKNTATEHRMMEKLMIDDLLHWARDYKVDGFRFDLMGHHMKRNLEKARDALHALTPRKDGVDGSAIYLYGEGWDFGEVQGGKRGVNATQANMAGTGVGTFNDRLRDAARGGSPFTDRREQGFATGLIDDPNGFGAGASPAEVLDRVRAGLVGNLKGFDLGGGDRAERFGAYTADPQESINYVSAHDNETLFDKIQFAAPAGATLADCVRMQELALSLVALAQGVPFFHAGSDILRSKSMDADSYNSGDWFNRLDFSLRTNNFGVGLPPAEKNRDRWDVMRPLLARADRRPGEAVIREAAARFRELLAIRRSSPLFRLRTAEEIEARVRFYNRGAGDGLIVMGINDEGPGIEDLDPSVTRVVVFFNGAREPRAFGDPRWGRFGFTLHPVQAASGDEALRECRFDPGTGSFTIPGRTAAVFVEPQS